MTCLTHSLWRCHRARPLSDDHVFDDHYIAVVPENSCVVSIFPVKFPDRLNPVIMSYGIWYEQISDFELTIALVRRYRVNWTTAYYREWGNMLQWYEPRRPLNFNAFHTKDSWDSLSQRHWDEYEKAVNKVIRFRA